MLDPSNLDLDWSPSCGATADDYAVLEGTLGVWYSHGPMACSTSGATTATITPGSGDRYYLVVPLDATREGSYGADSSGVERPRSNLRCRFQRDITPCPWNSPDPAAGGCTSSTPSGTLDIP